MSKYGVEESSFQPPKFQSEHDDWEEMKEKNGIGGDLLSYMKKKRGEECSTEGSHVHTGRPAVAPRVNTGKDKKKTDRKPNSKYTIISIIAIIYVLVGVITVLIEMLSF